MRSNQKLLPIILYLKSRILLIISKCMRILQLQFHHLERLLLMQSLFNNIRMLSRKRLSSNHLSFQSSIIYDLISIIIWIFVCSIIFLLSELCYWYSYYSWREWGGKEGNVAVLQATAYLNIISFSFPYQVINFISLDSIVLVFSCFLRLSIQRLSTLECGIGTYTIPVVW